MAVGYGHGSITQMAFHPFAVPSAVVDFVRFGPTGGDDGIVCRHHVPPIEGVGGVVLVVLKIIHCGYHERSTWGRSERRRKSDLTTPCFFGEVPKGGWGREVFSVHARFVVIQAYIAMVKGYSQWPFIGFKGG